MKRSTIVIFLCTLITFTAKGEIQLSGFGSIVGGIATGDDDIVDIEGVEGFHNEFEFKSGSFFAIQASSDLGDGLTATVQLLSKGENNWNTDFSWAYLSYEVSDEWKLLVGRQVVPFYMYSDYIDVSYAYHWIKPPSSYYRSPFSSFDGISSIYSNSFGESFITAHVFHGLNEDTSGDLPEGSKFTMNGGAFSYNYDWLTLQLNYTNFEGTIPIEGFVSLAQGWELAGFDDLADNILVKDDSLSIASLSVRLNRGNWLLISEYSKNNLDHTILANSDNWYLSAGYTIDSVMLHATFGVQESDPDYSLIADVPTGVGFDQLIEGTNAAITGQITDTPFYTFGLRWDFRESAALKIEYTHFNYKSTDLKANVLQVAITAVF